MTSIPIKIRPKKQKAFSLIELSIVVLIIGILIAGVTQSSSLLYKAKLNTARSLTESSPVASIKDLALWLETTSEKSFDDDETEDGTAATNWYDINPQVTLKSNAAGQSASALYTREGINGLPSLRFRGSTIGYYTVDLNSITNNGTKTVFAVARSFADRRNYIFDVSLGSQFAMILNTKTSATAVTYHQIYAGGSLISANGTSVINTNYVLVGVFNGADSTLRFNGNEVTGDVDVNTITNQIFVGRSVSNAGHAEFLDGYLGEFIIFDRVLKTEEYLAVEEYLAKKWGIELAS